MREPLEKALVEVEAALQDVDGVRLHLAEARKWLLVELGVGAVPIDMKGTDPAKAEKVIKEE